MKGFIKCAKKFHNVVILAKDESITQIKREIKNVSNFIFVKSLDEFEKNINPDSFLAISESITEFVTVANLIRQSPNCIFHYVDKGSIFTYQLINQIKEEVQLECQ